MPPVKPVFLTVSLYVAKVINTPTVHQQCVRRPAPLSYRLQSHLTPRGCWIPPLALNTTVRLPFCSHRSFSFKVHFFFFFCSRVGPQRLPPGNKVYLRSRYEARTAEAVLPNRSAEVWPLSVPALSQLCHRACSPDCLVTQWVVSLCCLDCIVHAFPTVTAPAWRSLTNHRG